jgi:hypothetical protein
LYSTWQCPFHVALDVDEAGDDDELGLVEGDVITNVEPAGEGWVTVRADIKAVWLCEECKWMLTSAAHSMVWSLTWSLLGNQHAHWQVWHVP